MDKANPRICDDGIELIFECEDVVAISEDGTEALSPPYWCGWSSDTSIEILLGESEASETGSGAWFNSDGGDTFTSTTGSEGSGDNVPAQIRFGKLVVKQILGS